MRREIERNLKLNRPMGRLSVSGLALSDEAGVGTIYSKGILASAPSFIPDGVKKPYPVQTVRGDDLILSGYERPRRIKCDVEGMEFKVLKGMEGLFSSGEKPSLFLEI